MEGRHRLDAVSLVPRAAVLGNPEVLVYDRLGGGTAEAEDDLRFDGPDLALQVGVAGPYLAGLRLAVLEPAALLDGRAALHDVRQVDLLARQVHGRQDIVEELARPPDEGQSRGVFVLAGPLADEHQRRVGVPGREDRVGAALRQVALGTHGDLTGELLQPSLAVLAALRDVEKTLQGSSMMLACLQTILHRRPGSPGEHLLRTVLWPTMPTALQREGRDRRSSPRGITRHGRDGGRGHGCVPISDGGRRRELWMCVDGSAGQVKEGSRNGYTNGRAWWSTD